MTISDAQKKAAERARKRAAGLFRLELWLPKALHQKVKQYAERLAKKAHTGSKGNEK